MARGWRPPRVAVIGIDGSGKSSTALRAIWILARDLSVIKPGRNPFAQEGKETTDCVPTVARFFERLFERADRTRRRPVIALSRLLFVLYQGWLEPHMIRRFRPQILVNTRCMIVDPAIYLDFYFPALAARVSTKTRLKISRILSRLSYSDLYVLLDTPPATAMERIHKRIEKAPGYESQPRDYWLHLHEDEAILASLGAEFPRSLAVARELADFEVVTIDTTAHSEVEVAEIIAEHARALIESSARARPHPRLRQVRTEELDKRV